MDVRLLTADMPDPASMQFEDCQGPWITVIPSTRLRWLDRLRARWWQEVDMFVLSYRGPAHMGQANPPFGGRGSGFGIRDRVGVLPYIDPESMRARIGDADAVADSFVLGVLGMVGLRATSVDRPAICFVDQDEYVRIHVSVSPVHNTRTVDCLRYCLEELYRGGVRRATGSWMTGSHHPSVAASIMRKAMLETE